MWLLGLCCDTCKASYKLPVTASASHQADGGVTHFLKMWILIDCLCVCACVKEILRVLSVRAESKVCKGARSD